MGSIQMEETKPTFPAEANSESYARQLDAKCHMREFRNDFIIPTKKSLTNKQLHTPGKFSRMRYT